MEIASLHKQASLRRCVYLHIIIHTTARDINNKNESIIYDGSCTTMKASTCVSMV